MLKNIINTFRMITATIHFQKKLEPNRMIGLYPRGERGSTMVVANLFSRPSWYDTLLARLRDLRNACSNGLQILRKIGTLRVYTKGRLIDMHDIQDKISQQMQTTMRKFAEENRVLEKDNTFLKNVIQQERNYAQMLIRLNNVTQNLFTITDRKVLLRTVTTSLCEDLNFTSAVLWVFDKTDQKWFPISWANVSHDMLQRLSISFEKRPYSDLITHRKSYFLVDDTDIPEQTDNSALQHIHELSRVLESPVIFLIPIVSFHNPKEMVENFNGEVETSAILMVGKQETTRLMESKEILQRYAYSAGLTLGNVDIYNYLHENYRSLKQQAITDGLTGLYNRRFFNEELEREMQRSYRHFLRMSLILLDVDHFKKYNDTNGHQAGDEVLKKVASLLREHTRVCDLECRYGGEEFALILPETNKEQALVIAEKLRQTVESTHFDNQEKQPLGNLTISMGVSTFPDDSIQIKELIDKADKGLYKAKELGRNVVVGAE
ncbi:GGDEF domain-containing protein [bacterium]|nr:GGDEF domain-containing protein [bacterium]